MKIEPANIIRREYHIIQDGGPLSDDFITKEIFSFKSLSVFQKFQINDQWLEPIRKLKKFFFLVESDLTRTADKFWYNLYWSSLRFASCHG